MKKRKFNILKCLCLIIPALFLSGCKTTNTSINSVEEAKTGSYIVGALSLTYCEEMIPTEFPNAKDVRIFNDTSAAYQALQEGKIDVFVQDSTMARVELSKGLEGLKILDDRVGGSQSVAAGISPTSSVVNKLTIDNLIKKYKSSGFLEDLYKRWCEIGVYAMPEIDEVVGASKNVLKVCTSGTVEPFSFFLDGELTGLEIELARKIARDLDLKLEFEINGNYTALISSVETGKSDLLMANLYCTEERREQIPLSEPYSTTYAKLIVRDSSGFAGYTSVSELQGKRVGYDISSTHFENIVNKFLPNSEISTYNNSVDCLTALKNSRIEAYVTDLPVAEYISANDSSVKILPEYLDSDSYGFMFQSGSPIAIEFSSVIQEFKDTGKIDEIKEKWFNKETQPTSISEQKNSPYKKTLKAITTAIFEPFAYIGTSGKILGIEADLLVQIGEKLNYKIEFLPAVASINSITAAMSQGMADIGFNVLSISPEREEMFDFTIPFYEGAVVLVVRNEAAVSKNFFEKLSDSFYKTFVKEKRWMMILEGTGVTLLMSICSGVIGVVLGFALCLIRSIKFKPLSKVVKFINRLIQGTPIVVLLMIMYYVIFGKIDISALVVAILAFGINFGVFSSEIMHSGFDSVERGQLEAASAMGYSRTQVFFKISLPQAGRKFIPVLRQEFISMLKMTSVAGYISVAELTRVGDIIRSRTLEAFFPLIVVALIYFGLSELLTVGLSVIDKKLDNKNKPFKMKGVKTHE